MWGSKVPPPGPNQLLTSYRQSPAGTSSISGPRWVTLNNGMLQPYVRLAKEPDLGPRADWLELIANNPAREWS